MRLRCRQLNRKEAMKQTAAHLESEQQSSRPTRRERLSLAAILLATLFTYLSTFTFGWVYDDPPQIPQNPNLQWGRLGYLFTHHLWASAVGPEARFYRPLLTLWFLINKTLFGLDPHWFHVTTVLAHISATALAYAIARKLLRDAGAALFAAAIFGLHPLQVESASWISAVNDPLSAAFCFASFLACRRARATEDHPGKWWVLAGLFFLLALLAKEMSIVLPAIILVDLWVDSMNPDFRKPHSSKTAPPRSTRAFSLMISVYAVLGVLWLAFRSHILGQATATYSFVGWKTTLLTAPKVLLFYLYRVILPVRLSPHYDFRLVESPAEVQFFLNVCVLVVLIALAVFAAKRNPQLWVAFAWLVFPLLPTLNLRWMNQHDFIHDRYMYMSMSGVALLAGSAYAALRQKWPDAKLVRPVAIALVVVLAFASAIQSQYWANDVILFSRAVQVAPQNEWAHLNYGSALSARGKYAEAATHFVRSYELMPNWRAADFAGFSYQQSGDLSGSERWFTRALQLNPELPTAWFGLAQIRLQQHKPEEAINFLKKALELQPNSDGYHFLMGTVLEEVSRPSDALKEYEIELQLHPYQTGARKAIERLQATPLNGK
jgi:protein O-mannosyl-transferase